MVEYIGPPPVTTEKKNQQSGVDNKDDYKTHDNQSVYCLLHLPNPPLTAGLVMGHWAWTLELVINYPSSGHTYVEDKKNSIGICGKLWAILVANDQSWVD